LVGENPECYSNGSSTALCESLHNVNNSYCPKGEKYSNSVYEIRKDLALLDWNFRKEKIHPMEWKKELTSSFIQSFLKTQQINNEIALMDIETI
jgi:hypothetical protein